MSLTTPFEQLCEDHTNYPENIPTKTICKSTRTALKAKLDEHDDRLFLSSDHRSLEVACRDIIAGDYTPSGISHVLTTENPAVSHRDVLLKGEQDIKNWFTHMNLSPQLLQSNESPRQDPDCRFVFVYAKDSRSLLKISRPMFTSLLSYHQVMPKFVDFVFPFGEQLLPMDHPFYSFCQQTQLQKPGNGVLPGAAALGRSGRQFQISYNIRYVASKVRVSDGVDYTEWNIRHAAVHHQFDVETGKAFWLMVGGRDEIKDRASSLTGPESGVDARVGASAKNNFLVTLSVHLAYAHWAAENWRWYLQFLEKKHSQTNSALYDDRGPHKRVKTYMPTHLQDIQRLEDSNQSVINVLKGNVEVLQALRTYYESLLSNKHFEHAADCAEGVNDFVAELNNIIFDQKAQVQRAQLLAQLIAQRKTLIHQFLQVESTEKAESLSISMRDLTIGAQKEAIAMRIITVVTLFFLPATFVSKAFFSTDVVKYQNQDGVEIYSSLALMRWLQVALPLTALTLVLGFVGYLRVRKGQAHKLSKDVPIRILAHQSSFGMDTDVELGELLPASLRGQSSWKTTGG